ncbi:hypothetical protein [Azohydromonas australica]|uniref:hypothetical protein n=1 Tax=Azohydromonas australica TaxID=364039 RepID=UPI0012ECB7C2|nr:hypothetical protein [Azohydromonas australica]
MSTTEMKQVPPDGLIASAKGRTNDFVARLEEAMRRIEMEIEQNDGVYPLNKGRVNQAEVCRRAGKNKRTLQTSIHKDTTKKRVDEFVGRVSAGLVSGRKSVRKAVTERADYWKAEHNKIADNYHLMKLEQIEDRRRIAELEKEVRKLVVQIEVMNNASSVRVRSLPKRKE